MRNIAHKLPHPRDVLARAALARRPQPPLSRVLAQAKASNEWRKAHGLMSPFLEIPERDWLAANAFAFAFHDRFPVSPGHTLVVTRRPVATFFEATPEEQAAVMALVVEMQRRLEAELDPKPDGWNVGFNSGAAAGQTVFHLHVHLIPRYTSDVDDPRGGVRHVIPSKANYIEPGA